MNRFSVTYIDTLKSELSIAKTYELISTDEKSVVDKHCSYIETKFAVGITEKLPTFYWLPKLHKRPYKARFIANTLAHVQLRVCLKY